MTFEELCQTVDARREGVAWMAYCPAHPDGSKAGRRSLHISERKDGRGSAMHCFAGCETPDILDMFELTFDDLYSSPKEDAHVRTGPHRSARPKLDTPDSARKADRGTPREPDASRPADVQPAPDDDRPASGGPEHGARTVEYVYRDEAGEPTSIVIRTDLADGSKKFSQYRPDGLKSLDGVRRVPYNLPMVLASDKPVFVAEGEKCAEALIEVGLVGTTLLGGAGCRWTLNDQHLHFAGKVVVLLPDYDEAGAKWTEAGAEALKGVAKRVHVVELPDVLPKGDVADWLADGHTAADLVALIPRPFHFLTSDEVKRLPPPRYIDEARKDRIPLIMGDTAILAGPSNVGKSFLALEWACELAALGHKVLYLALEDLHGNGVRLEAWEMANGERAQVEWNTADMYLNLADREQVDALCEAVEGYKLVVIDNLNESGYEDENDAVVAGTMADSLKRLTRATEGGVVLAVHNFGHGSNRIRGHSKLIDRIDTMIYAKSLEEEDESDHVFTVWSGKQRHGRKFSAYRLQRVEIGPSIVLYEAPARPDEVLEAVRAGSLTAAEVVAQTDLSRAEVFKRLKQLVADGVLGKKDQIYHLVVRRGYVGGTSDRNGPNLQGVPQGVPSGPLQKSPPIGARDSETFQGNPPLRGPLTAPYGGGSPDMVEAVGLVEQHLDGRIV